jgi:hypothetical protein
VAATTPASGGFSFFSPEELRHTWVSPLGEVPGFPGQNGGVALDITATEFSFHDHAPFVSTMNATISVPEAGQIQLESSENSAGCTILDHGTYGWSLSPSGSSLTLSLLSDACAARAGALPGRWTQVRCLTDQGCLGDVDAGTFTTPYFMHPLSFTLPDGWADADEGHHDIALQRQADYAADGTLDQASFTRPALKVYPDTLPEKLDDACNAVIPADGSRGIDALAAWVASRPGVDATPPASTTVDRHPAVSIDDGRRPAGSTRAPRSATSRWLPSAPRAVTSVPAVRSARVSSSSTLAAAPR